MDRKGNRGWRAEFASPLRKEPILPIPENLEGSARRFKQLADNINEVFFLAKPDLSKILYISPAFEKIWGLSCEALLNNALLWADCIHKEDQPLVFESLRTMKPQSTCELNYRINRPDGNDRSIWVRCFTIPEQDGESYLLCGVATDVTVQKENEQLIVDQKSKMITASKMSALGEMAAGIAHEINNPLAVIQFGAEDIKELLQSDFIDPIAIAAVADQIEVTVMRISKIIRGLRTFSRDAETDAFQKVSINSIISDSVDLCSERLKKHGVDLQISMISDDLKIECRAIQISQVLLNLLNNSFDANEARSEKWIKIDVRESESGVEISVTDNGIGIDPKYREKILHPFFTTKEIGKGTGLGLSISKGIIEAHSGTLRLDVESPCTRFVISLPKIQEKIQQVIR